MKKVVITGATGFVGSHLAKKLLKDGVKVYGVGRNKARLDELAKYGDFVPVVADFEQYENLHKLIDDRDFCMFWHLAWEGTSSSTYNDINLQSLNIKVSSDAAEAAVNLRCKAAAFCSSYQQSNVTLEDFDAKFNPTIYGIMKKCASDTFKAIAYKNSINCNNIVFPNVFGIGDKTNTAIMFFIKHMLANKPLKLIDGTYPDDWVYIDDLIDGIIYAAKSNCKYKDYYIGHRRITTFKEKLESIKTALASESELSFGQYPESYRIDYDDFDLQALKVDTGFEITSSFEERVRQTAEWIKGNKTSNEKEGEKINAPCISIIILTYKNLHYLPNCLSTIFSQTYGNIELIVSDDCSDDFDAEGVKAYIQQNKGDNITSVIVSKNETNVGTVKNSNIGLGFARGEYVTFMPCDDEYSSESSIADMVAGFDNFPNAQVIVGRIERFDENMSKVRKHVFSYHEQVEMIKKMNSLPQDELLGCFEDYDYSSTVSGAIFRRGLFQDIGGFDEDFFLYTDIPLFLTLIKEGYVIRYLDVLCTNYRKDGISTSIKPPLSFAHKMFAKDQMLLWFEKTNWIGGTKARRTRQARVTSTYLAMNECLELGLKIQPVEVVSGLLSDVNRNLSAECIVFGLGHLGIGMYKYLTKAYRILAYTDNSPVFWGNEINGLPVVPTSELDKFKGADIVICSVFAFFEVAEQLTEMGFGSQIVLPQLFWKEGELS